MAAELVFSVVIPVYDEGDSIAELLDEVRESLPGAGAYEIIVVDDGSRDDTRQRLLAAPSSKGPRIRVLRHPENLGQSAALSSGIRAAHAEWVVTLDGDGQNDPADIPRLLDACRSEDSRGSVGLVCGHRSRRQDPLSKVFSSRIANSIRRRLLGDGTPDAGCGLKVIHRETFLDLPFFDHMHRFLPALVARAGGRVVSIEVNHRPRTHGRSKYGLHDRLWVGVADMMGVLWLQRRSKSLSVTELGRGDDVGIG